MEKCCHFLRACQPVLFFKMEGFSRTSLIASFHQLDTVHQGLLSLFALQKRRRDPCPVLCLALWRGGGLALLS